MTGIDLIGIISFVLSAVAVFAVVCAANEVNIFSAARRLGEWVTQRPWFPTFYNAMIKTENTVRRMF